MKFLFALFYFIAIVRNIRLSKTQISMEKLIIKSSVRPNDDDDLQLKRLKTSVTVEENKEEIKGKFIQMFINKYVLLMHF